MEKLFVDIMVEQVTRGNIINGVFHDWVWPTILQEMNTKSGRTYTINQIKHKFNLLRIKDSAFSDILSTTGCGWARVRGKRWKLKVCGGSGTSHPHDDDSLEKAMEILSAMPFTAEVRVKAVPKFAKPDYRKMFIHMPEDMRESWLLCL